MDPAIVEARAVEKTFDSGGAVTTVLRGVDLRVAPGEFIAVMGPSGCGKSTLLHALGGLDRPTAGEIYLAGRRVDGLSERDWAVIRRRQIGYMFQSFNLIANMSAAENIELPALIAGLGSREARRRRDDLLQQLGIGDRASYAPGQLSGGQQQRVALARALVNQPDVLLADEPTGNLDTASTREVLAMLRDRHAHGQTMILVTHDPNVAAAADRTVHMIDGQISDTVGAQSATVVAEAER